VAIKSPHISHATFMTLKQGIMGFPGVYDQHTGSLLLFYVTADLSFHLKERRDFLCDKQMKNIHSYASEMPQMFSFICLRNATDVALKRTIIVTVSVKIPISFANTV